ncbi:MAG: hypothetical protein A2087_04875 [Spirochaetes bacterium GWD1_61_31]|nr:MAG: hypothetical protein A2Y37_01585 [Spirochaetes bacterium GWB1_60_80]OHD34907.1 MAG: hypothetical protein A2004_00615 [Spirochaetes bacterium GWC1_61_12]OHD37064.1 MAG: hypothetical protein A2087_04875 [Spirochaetes bacterium GWD1_61_31]OHD45326.1 MAG: hypothetical protein A2Y35_00515 [Spirochaetes bacterium GWE1_60_18]OHD61078.1 MAG: hypothetical protein A2Y32_09200 [Spirochaetes bacterium GWF1_60_12]HAP42738.1 hypothetical protein [Spirochaetaceae bacterium]
MIFKRFARTALVVPLLLSLISLLSACPQPPVIQEPTVEAGQRLFWVNDLADYDGWHQIGVDKVYEGDRCVVWVRRLDAADISVSLLEEFGQHFDDVSWNNVTSYVHQPTEFFDDPNGQVVNIVFYQAADNIAGYFWSKDFYSTETYAYSNETNIFYMNIGAAVYSQNQAAATLFTKGTLTHEFQHLCNAHYFTFGDGANRSEMDTWANELCSTTAESVFSGQFPVYVNVFENDQDNDFKSGRTDFLAWDKGTALSGFTPYTVAALFGGYLLSRLPEAARPKLIQTFLAYTGQDDQSTNSVSDLLLALQDPEVAYAGGADWVTLDPLNLTNAAVATDWAIVMGGFVHALTGKDAAYLTYLQTVAPDVSHIDDGLDPPTLAAGTTSLSLAMSGFAIGRTKVASLDSTSLADASTSGSAAWLLAWNGAIPGSFSSPVLSSAATFAADEFLARPAVASPLSRDLTESGYPTWVRDSPTAADTTATATTRQLSVFIPGLGNVGNPSDGTTDGHLYGAYAARP